MTARSLFKTQAVVKGWAPTDKTPASIVTDYLGSHEGCPYMFATKIAPQIVNLPTARSLVRPLADFLKITSTEKQMLADAATYLTDKGIMPMPGLEISLISIPPLVKPRPPAHG